MTMVGQHHTRTVPHLLASLGSLLVLALLSTGCAASANRFHVDKSTPLNQSTPAGVAIHLDAQQRLVLSTAMGYCAEPSPDALSAYASSLGVSFRTSDADAVTLANTLQSLTGSIGLRTQSITLMRDALYRVCEASNNRRLSSWEVAAFLRQSQDLTAVILAIEQLTDVVKADQIILAPNLAASASTLPAAAVQPEQAGTPQPQPEQPAPEPQPEPEQPQPEQPQPEQPQPEQPQPEQPQPEQPEPEQPEPEQPEPEQPDGATAVILTSQNTGFVRAGEVGGARFAAVDPQTATAVVAAVRDIVFKVLDQNYMDEMCISFLASLLTDTSIDVSRSAAFGVDLIETCNDVLANEPLAASMPADGGTTETAEFSDVVGR